MTKNLTRRQWAAGAISVTTATAAAALPQAAAGPDSPDEVLAQARQALERDRAALRGYKLAIALEPATRFEA